MGPMGPIGPMVGNRHLKFIRRPSKLTYVDIQERKSLKCLGSILLPSPVFKLDRWLLWHLLPLLLFGGPWYTLCLTFSSVS